jgi:hypothetical protein
VGFLEHNFSLCFWEERLVAGPFDCVNWGEPNGGDAPGLFFWFWEREDLNSTNCVLNACVGIWFEVRLVVGCFYGF